TPVEEGVITLYRWMVEELGAKPRKADKLVLAALEIYAARPLPKDEFPKPTPGNPASRLNEFGKRWMLGQGMAHAPEDIREAHRYSLPRELIARCKARFGDERAAALCESMGTTAPLELRVNRLLGSREDCHAAQLAERHACSPTRWSPDGLRLARK